MVTEKQGEIQDHTYHRRRDGREWRSEFQIIVRRFNKGGTRKNKNKRGQEGKPGDNGGGLLRPREYRVGAKYRLVHIPQ